MELTNLFKLTYMKIIEKIYAEKDSFPENEITCLTPGKGKNYKNKLMIVGRAPKGSDKLFFDKNNPFGKEQIFSDLSKLSEFDKLQWVFDKWGKTEGTAYNTKKSAFWRMAKELGDGLITDLNKVESIHSIVWSDLYRFAGNAPGEGNPSSKLKNIQFEGCKSLLTQEIQIFDPEIIIILAGLDWASPFLKNDSNIIKIEHDSNMKFVEFTGKMGSKCIVVAKHPQGRGKPLKPFADEILRSVKKLIDL